MDIKNVFNVIDHTVIKLMTIEVSTFAPNWTAAEEMVRFEIEREKVVAHQTWDSVEIMRVLQLFVTDNDTKFHFVVRLRCGRYAKVDEL